MAKQAQVSQSTNEEKVYPLDFTPALLEGVIVTDVTLVYEGDNPDESPPELSVPSIDAGTNIAYVAVAGLDVGQHKVSCIAVTDNEDLSPEIQLLIKVNW